MLFHSYGSFRTEAIPWVARYLTENEPTPYAHIRDSMQRFSAVLQNRRKKPQVHWISPKNLLLNQQEIDLDQFRSLLHFQLKNLELFFLEKLLFGNTLESLGITVDFKALKDSGDTTTIWYSPLLGDIWGNEDSNKLLKKLVGDGTLLMHNGTELVWDMGMAETWVADNHAATCQTYCATHITEGSSSRVTEEAKTQCSNTRTGRRHVFVMPGINTLCIWSNYWKGTTKSGTFKEILHIIPFRVSRLIFILVQVIRPVITLYLAEHSVTADNRLALKTTYSTNLWATLGSTITPKQMYRAILVFLRSPNAEGNIPFNFSFGERQYWQFIAAVQNKHLPGSPKYRKVEREESVGDRQAGRSGQTSHQHYAIEESTIDRDPGFIEHYISYSKKWHEFWRISTEHGKDDQYFV